MNEYRRVFLLIPRKVYSHRRRRNVWRWGFVKKHPDYRLTEK